MITDIYGTVIQPGDYINYPVRQSSSMWMTTAKVLEVKDNKLKVAALIEEWQNTKVRTVYVSAIERVTILPKSYAHRARFKELTYIKVPKKEV